SHCYDSFPQNTCWVTGRLPVFCLLYQVRPDHGLRGSARHDLNGGPRARQRKASIRSSAMAASDMHVVLGIVWRRYSLGKLLAMPWRGLSVSARVKHGAFSKLRKWRCERLKPPSAARKIN